MSKNPKLCKNFKETIKSAKYYERKGNLEMAIQRYQEAIDFEYLDLEDNKLKYETYGVALAEMIEFLSKHEQEETNNLALDYISQLKAINYDNPYGQLFVGEKYADFKYYSKAIEVFRPLLNNDENFFFELRLIEDLGMSLIHHGIKEKNLRENINEEIRENGGVEIVHQRDPERDIIFEGIGFLERFIFSSMEFGEDLIGKSRIYNSHLSLFSAYNFLSNSEKALLNLNLAENYHNGEDFESLGFLYHKIGEFDDASRCYNLADSFRKEFNTKTQDGINVNRFFNPNIFYLVKDWAENKIDFKDDLLVSPENYLKDRLKIVK